ncbi:hypothetical protein BGZ83_003992 [Gryganskiella cystojenkinii]|nr:hypothetical protein BGZ83_003992 [Gryganskiella cystojenkinii]
MQILLLSGLLTLASSVLADVTYNLIGFPDAAANSFAVEINKKLYPLRTSQASFPLWSATVAGVSASADYRYVQLNNKKKAVLREEFVRQLTDTDTTPNEFFNRQETFTTLPSIKQVYKDVRPKSLGAFDSSQIATMHFTADPDEFTDMMNNPTDKNRKPLRAGFKFINANTVYSVDEVKLQVSGHNSRKHRKVSLKVKFHRKRGEMLFGNAVIKLRAEYVDPTMLREKLYIDILNSIGVPSSQASYCRVYVNGKPHGFFLMVEDLEESMLMRTVHRGAIKEEKALGALYKMGTRESTLKYVGPHTDNYEPWRYKNVVRGNNPKDEPMKQIIGFMKDIRDWDPADAEGVAYWNERLDLDGFLRSMALEYMAGAWDSFWWNGNNYFMYYNPQREVWQFLPSDFDHSFSSGGNRVETETPYKKYAQNGRFTFKNHPLVAKLIFKNKDINKKFETILHTITQDVFSSAELESRIQAYETQIEQEVEWDISIDRSELPGTEVPDLSVVKFHKSIWKIHNGVVPWIRGRAKSNTRQNNQ